MRNMKQRKTVSNRKQDKNQANREFTLQLETETRKSNTLNCYTKLHVVLIYVASTRGWASGLGMYMSFKSSISKGFTPHWSSQYNTYPSGHVEMGWQGVK